MERNIQLIINGNIIDSKDISNISINLLLKDVQDFNKNKTSFTKPISVLQNKANDVIFKSAFDINASWDKDMSPYMFNPNLKIPGELRQDGFVLISGNIQLTEITNTTYEIVLSNADFDLFQTLGEELIRGNDDKTKDLSFDSTVMQHTPTQHFVRTKINEVLDFTTDDNFVYPFIDYENLKFEDIIRYNTTNLLPAIQIKPVFDKIISDAGYTYEMSTGLTEVIRELFIPYNGGINELCVPETYAQKLHVGKKAVYTKIDDEGYVRDYFFDTNADKNLLLDCDENFSYSKPLTIFGNFTIKPVVTLSLRADINPSKTQDATVYFVTGDRDGNITETELGEIKLTSVFSLYNFNIDDGSTGFTYTYCDIHNLDAVGIKVVTNDNNCYILGYNSYIDFYIQNWLYSGEKVLNINDLLPYNYKKVDLLNDIFKMFNCYVEVDKLNSKNLLIKTYSEYFGAGKVLDWSNKVDDTQVSIQQNNAYMDKVYNFKFAEGKDAYNQDYITQFGDGFGNYKSVSENEFVTTENTKQLACAATVFKSFDFPVFEFKIPIITNNQGFNSSWEPRILFYNQFEIGIGFYYWTWGTDQFYGSFEELNYFPTLSDKRYGNYTEYDNDENIVLNFNAAKTYAIVYEDIQGVVHPNVSNRTLYNLYHKEDIERLLDVNTKLLKIKAVLSNNDISNLSLADKVFISSEKFGDAYYRINSIKNFSGDNKLCDLELIKLNYYRNEFDNYLIPEFVNYSGPTPSEASGSSTGSSTGGGVTPSVEAKIVIYNVSGDIIPIGSVVRPVDYNYGCLNVVLAQANDDDNIKGTLLVTTATIPVDEFGYGISFGKFLYGDTSEIPGTGDLLYLSSTVPGQITTIVPDDSRYIVKIGYILNSGDIFVDINTTNTVDNLIAIADLYTGCTDTHIPFYNSASKHLKDSPFTVVNGKVGLNKPTPIYDLDISGTTKTNNLTISNISENIGLTKVVVVDNNGNTFYKINASSSGTSGTSGTSGINGTSGTSGNSGTSGTSGTSGILPVIGNSTEIIYRDDTAQYKYNTSTGLTYDYTNKVLILNSLKITGGTTANNSIFTSDVQGLGSWKTLAELGIQPALNGTGFIKINGTTISYDNSTYALASSLGNYVPYTGAIQDVDLGVYSLIAKSFGLNAGKNNPTLNRWVAIGPNAAFSSTTGVDWIAIGPNAGYYNQTGVNWVAIGLDAGKNNTVGGNWTAIGPYAGSSNTVGFGWTAIGVLAGNANIDGNQFTAIGTRAGMYNTNGSYWTAIGSFSGAYLSDGTTSATSFNTSTYIGSFTKVSANDVSNENVIGYNTVGLGSNTFSFGNYNITKTVVRGKFGINTDTPMARLSVLETTRLGQTAGDYQIISSQAGYSDNYFQNNQYLLRKTNGSDWISTRWHDGISVDVSFVVPGSTTRCWWERDPALDVQSWGTNDIPYMTLNSSGLGIGTTNPVDKICAVGGAVSSRCADSNGVSYVLAQSSGYYTIPNYAATYIAYCDINNTGNYFPGVPRANSGSLIFQNVSTALISTNGDTPIIFATLSAERMRILSNGKIGIGLINPTYELDVVGAVNSTGGFYENGVKLTSGSGGMVYPPAGIAVSTGSAWTTSITNNSTNWNTAYTYRLTSASGSGPLTLSLSNNALTGSIKTGSIASGGTNLVTSGTIYSYLTSNYDKYTSWNLYVDGTNYKSVTSNAFVNFAAGSNITLSYANSTITINAASGGGSMVYPGAGIAVSTGSAWGTSITNNSAKWNTAYTYRLTSATGSGPLTLSLSNNALTGSIATGNVVSGGTNLVTGGTVYSYLASNYDKYSYWNLYVGGTLRANITATSLVNFVGGTNVTLAYSSTNNTVTINSTGASLGSGTWGKMLWSNNGTIDGANTVKYSGYGLRIGAGAILTSGSSLGYINAMDQNYYSASYGSANGTWINSVGSLWQNSSDTTLNVLQFVLPNYYTFVGIVKMTVYNTYLNQYSVAVYNMKAVNNGSTITFETALVNRTGGAQLTSFGFSASYSSDTIVFTPVGFASNNGQNCQIQCHIEGSVMNYQ
jgi:hypothetical protein